MAGLVLDRFVPFYEALMKHLKTCGPVVVSPTEKYEGAQLVRLVEDMIGEAVGAEKETSTRLRRERENAQVTAESRFAEIVGLANRAEAAEAELEQARTERDAAAGERDRMQDALAGVQRLLQSPDALRGMQQMMQPQGGPQRTVPLWRRPKVLTGLAGLAGLAGLTAGYAASRSRKTNPDRAEQRKRLLKPKNRPGPAKSRRTKRPAAGQAAAAAAAAAYSAVPGLMRHMQTSQRGSLCGLTLCSTCIAS